MTFRIEAGLDRIPNGRFMLHNVSYVVLLRAAAEGGLFFETPRIGAFGWRTRLNHAMPRLSRLFILLRTERYGGQVRLRAERWPRFRPAGGKEGS